MSKKRRKKAIIIFLLILLVFAVLLYVFLFRLKSSNKVVDKIEGYNYTLDNRDSELMKKEFTVLKDILSKKDVDFEKYARSLSKLFVIDLYTMSTKINKYDVGGVEFINPDHVDVYKLKVEDTIYAYLEDSSARKNNKKLPTVKSIEVTNIESTEYEYANGKYDAYILNLEWKYEKDLGYDKNAIVTLIKIEDKLYVAEFTPEVEE